MIAISSAPRRSVRALAHAVDLTVVDILRQLDCDLVQGYPLGRPAAVYNL